MEITKYNELKARAEARDKRLTTDDQVNISSQLNKLAENGQNDDLEKIFVLIYHHFMISKALKVTKNNTTKKGIPPFKGKMVNKQGADFDAKNIPQDLQEILFCIFFK